MPTAQLSPVKKCRRRDPQLKMLTDDDDDDDDTGRNRDRGDQNEPLRMICPGG